jgi:hypothetical protein
MDFSSAYSYSNREIRWVTDLSGGPGSSVGIATGYGDRIPVGVLFFVHIQTGPGAHPASCTMGTGSFPGVKQPGRGADHTPTSNAEVTKA